MAQAVDVALDIQGMTTAACAARVERALGALSGVSAVSVNPATGRARVRVDRDVLASGAVEATVADTGYEVPVVLARLDVSGMSCAACVGRVERALRGVPGVRAASVNLATQAAHVALSQGSTTTGDLLAALERAGYRGAPAATDGRERAERAAAAARARRWDQWVLGGAALLTAPLLAPMLLAPFGVHAMPPAPVQLALATPVQFIAGAPFLRGAWRSLRAGAPGMDVLVTLGTTAAFSLSIVLWLQGEPHLYFESAAAVITFVRLGKALEATARRHTTDALRAIAALRPDHAVLRRDDHEVVVPVETVAPGDTVVVRPGGRVPVDGVVVAGASELDLSLLTGESLPVPCTVGAPVVGGALNGGGLLEVQATRVGPASTLARIAASVEDAQASRAPVQRLVDRVAAVFVPAVVGLALVTAIGWLLAGAAPQTAVLHAVAVLVVACPCALGLATPAALVVGTGAAARAGILVRDAETLERARAVQVAALDKTGTLTAGRPDVVAVLSDAPEEVLSLGAAAQQGSEHPLARAFVRGASTRGLPVPPLERFRAWPGRGVEATTGGREVRVGSARMLAELGLDGGTHAEAAARHEAQGHTVVWVIVDGVCRGAVALGDSLRPGAATAIARLREAGLRVVMLTGDRRATAEAVAGGLGLDEVIAEVLPDDKADVVRRLQAQGHRVVMVGDGVNDAPALAAADVGVAMGGGTDVAVHAAGFTLLRDDPILVADALALARATHRTIAQNLFWAFLFNVLGLPLAALGWLTPTVAGAAMALSSVTVVGNALRLARWRPGTP